MIATAGNALMATNPAYDPVLPLREAAEYLGFRGDDPVRSLRRLNLERTPLPGTGTHRQGIRLSVLNAYLASLTDPKARAPKVRKAPRDTMAPRERGRFARRAS